MKRIFTAFIVILLFYPYLARADSTGSPQVCTAQSVSSFDANLPDVRDWNVVTISRVALKISDQTIAYLGLEVEYNNPNNPDESVRVIYRHIALIVSKPVQANERLLSEMTVVFYTQKEEQERLLEISKETDPIIYIRWQVKKSPRTGHDLPDGDVRIWFFPPEGPFLGRSWYLFKNEKVETEFMTENVGNGEPHNVFSGMKYCVGKADHIIRVDRSDLEQLFQGGPALRSLSEGGQ